MIRPTIVGTLKVVFGLLLVPYALAMVGGLLTAWLIFGGPVLGSPVLWAFIFSLPAYPFIYLYSLDRVGEAERDGLDQRVVLRRALLPAAGLAWTIVTGYVWLTVCNGSFGACPWLIR